MTRRSRPRAFAALVLLAAPALLALQIGNGGADVVELPLPDFKEPSGIIYHPSRHSLFLIGDEGDIGEMALDGTLLRQFHLGGDLEAITVNPSSGLLYVAREGYELIYEVRPDDFSVLRRFGIDRTWQGNPNFLKRGGDGIEGLTFVPDDTDPEGGRLWAVNQYDPPVLVELAIPLKTSTEKYATAKILRAIPVDPAPLSEVTWDPVHREFLVLSALWKRVAVLDADGKYERSVHVPGFMPEGLTRLPDARYAIAQDSGGVVFWKPAGDPFRGDVASGPPDPTDPGGDPVQAPPASPATSEPARSRRP